MNWTEFDERSTTSRGSPDPYRFNRAAQRFIDWLNEQGRYPLYYRNRFYTYDGTRYIEVENLSQMIRTFFKKAGLPQSNHMVGNVVPIVENRRK